MVRRIWQRLNNSASIPHSPAFYLAFLTLVIFVVEAGVMAILPHLVPEKNRVAEVIVDPLSLTLILLPLLYYLVFVPLKRAAQRAEQQLQLVLSGTTDAVLVVDSQGRIIACNSVAEKTFGCAEEELVGQKLEILVPEPYRQAHREGFERYVRTGKGRLPRWNRLEMEARYRDGSIVPVELSIGEMWDGKKRLFIGILRDISERKYHEWLLKTQSEVLSSIVQAYPIKEVLSTLCQRLEERYPQMRCSILILDEEGKHLHHGAAPSLPEVYTRAVDGLEIGPEVGSCGSAAYRKEIVIVSDIATDPRCAAFRELALPHGLRACWSVPILSGAGKVLGTFAIYYDQPREPTAEELQTVQDFVHFSTLALERYRAEAERQRLLQALESTTDSVVLTNRAGKIRWANSAFVRNTGYTLEEALGKTPGQLFKSGKHDRAFYEQLWSTILGGQVWQGEIINRYKDGTLHHEGMTITPVRDEGGEITHFLAIKRDITDHKRMEEELQRALQAAQAANRAKMSFLAMMSHEVRTPMNGILGMGQLLLQTPLTEEQREYLNILQRSAEVLLSVLNDILDFSKIEAGKLTLEQIPFNLHQLVQEIGLLFLPKARQQGLRLEVKIAPEVPPFVQGDPVRLRQIVSNLVSNALKFTPEGEVRIEVTSLGSQVPDEARIRLSVHDTGIGIPADKQAIIFDAFAQAEESTSRKYGGTGLGLSICKELTKLMNGQIGVESEEGKGSTFWVELPLALSAAPETELKDQESSLEMPLGLQVLLAEDNEVNQKVAIRMLEKLGCKIEVAKNGREAVEKTAASVYDVVLMDCQMSEMDGYEATRLIRQREQATGRHQVIIALTAHAFSGDRDRCLACGMDDYLEKPIKLESLVQMLRKWVTSRFPKEPAVPHPSSPPPSMSHGVEPPLDLALPPLGFRG